MYYRRKIFLFLIKTNFMFKRGEVIAFDTDYLTSLKSLRKNNHSVDDTVNVLVSIFNKMVKNVK